METFTNVHSGGLVIHLLILNLDTMNMPYSGYCGKSVANSEFMHIPENLNRCKHVLRLLGLCFAGYV